MKKTLQRGFTLIELLVVIAIIGILAAVVLASLNDARDGGRDASAKTSMTNLRSQAEIYYNSNTFSYLNVCDDPDIDELETAIGNNANTPVCNDVADEYAVSVELNDGTFFCIDSTGYSGPDDANLATGVTVCTPS